MSWVGKIAIGTLSSNSITLGNTYQWCSDQIRQLDVKKIDQNTIAVLYGNLPPVSLAKMSLIDINVSLDTFTITSTVTVSSTYYGLPRMSLFGDGSRVIISGLSSTAVPVLIDVAISGSSLTAGDSTEMPYTVHNIETFEDDERLLIIDGDLPNGLLRSMISTPAAPFKPLPENVSLDSCETVSDCDTTGGFMCVDDLCYTRKNRYLSIVENPDNAGQETARRVIWKADSQSDPVVIGWVGEPDANGFALLSTSPYYADWTTEPEVVHVGGCAISPDLDYLYIIQSIYEGKSTATESNYSDELVLGTAVFGDICGTSDTTPPNGVSNMSDIICICNFVGNDPEKVALEYADTTGTDAMNNIPNKVGNMSDVLDVVDSFGGGNPYPYYGPCDCPDVTCP